MFLTAYWTLHYIALCIVFYMYDCAFVTFFIKGYLTSWGRNVQGANWQGAKRPVTRL